MKNGTNRAKVIVAMSGGVDSSVAAALLKRQGFDVVGVHMKFWSDGQKAGNNCCTPESEKMARAVAKKIGIPFYVLNFKKEFKKAVVDYFLKAQKRGITPNPCVVCNKEIKFGLLLQKAMTLGADYIATGHYAILKNGDIFKSKDREKDQTYFLWKLDNNVLKHVLFPIGNYTKEEVRKLAEKFKLPSAKSKDSQEICFVPKTINEFLKKHLKAKKGNILDKEGKILGKHEGTFYYTVGQRKGIGLASGPYYVLSKKGNDVVVTKDENDLFKKEAALASTNLKEKNGLSAKIRYRSKQASGTLKGKKFVFSKPQRAITPGQSIVFYKGNKLVGGAIIK